MLDSFCGQVSKQPSEQHHSQAPEWRNVFYLLGGGYCSYLKAPLKKVPKESTYGKKVCCPLPMPVVKLQAHGPSARSCTFPWHTQLGLLLTNLYRAFVSATFLLSQWIPVWRITMKSYEISFVSFKKASIISPASAASGSVWIFQQEMQILHSESSILIILEFIHRKIKTHN